ncbi:MAG: hypothetical protein ACXWLL_13905, partial [Myxococcaceae bacterium]
SGLSSLQTLLLGGTKVTDEGLVHLRSLKRLRKLSIFDTSVTDAGIRHIAELPALEVLLAGRSGVTPEGQASLRARRPGISFDEPT